MNSSQKPTPWTEEDIQSSLKKILSRAGTDEAFRELCLKDPRTAVKDAIGRDLPEGFILQFIDNERADLTVVLPEVGGIKELSDDDLETVAGGCGNKGRGPGGMPGDPFNGRDIHEITSRTQS